MIHPSQMTAAQRSSFDRRVAEQIDRSGGPDACWIGPHGQSRGRPHYVRLGVGHNEKVYVNRYLMAMTIGRDLRSDEFVMHTCDNPPCCNPAHHVLGDHVQNAADAREKRLA